MRMISASGVGLALAGLALWCAPQSQASDQPDSQPNLVLAQAGGGGAGGGSGGSGGGMGGGTAGGTGSGGGTGSERTSRRRTEVR